MPDSWDAIRPHMLRVSKIGTAVMWERAEGKGRIEVTASPDSVFASYVGPRGADNTLYGGSVDRVRAQLARERELLDAIERACDIVESS